MDIENETLISSIKTTIEDQLGENTINEGEYHELNEFVDYVVGPQLDRFLAQHKEDLRKVIESLPKEKLCEHCGEVVDGQYHIGSPTILICKSCKKELFYGDLLNSGYNLAIREVKQLLKDIED